MGQVTVLRIVLLLLFSAQLGSAKSLVFTTQFQHWYPQYHYIWEAIMKENCTEEYERYLTGYRNQSNIDWLGGGGTLSAITQPVMNCILEHSSPYIQSVTTCAQVLLGLTPTILALLGASSDELAMLSNVAHRPVLAALLATGNPSVYLARAFEYYDPKEDLKGKEGRLTQRKPSCAYAYLIVTAEYTIAMAAVVNVALISYDLGTKSISSFMSDNVLGPMTWASLVIPIHIGGIISMRYRVRTRKTIDGGHGTGHTERGKKGFLSSICELWQTEITLSVMKQAMEFDFRDETVLFISLHWFLSTATICHIIFGTLILSSLLFVGPKDALGVVGRFMASALACRIVLMYEISGMRELFRHSTVRGEEGELFELRSTSTGVVQINTHMK